MHVATTILLLLFMTVLSSVLSRAVRLPLPLLQIAFGIAASMLGVHVAFEPDVFMLLFIPPLLFSEAYLMPMRELRELRRIILMLALGLVLFTTVGCGYFIQWLFPNLPLAACFTLAAVLSPTDAVAVAGMIEGRAVPHRFMHILSGEALLNDASGLVCFKFAAAAAMTGAFSVGHAIGGFVLMSAAGALVGAGLAVLMATIERWLSRRGVEDPTITVTISSLLPFAAYLAAEHLGASGILAAVAAGIALKGGRMFDSVPTETRLQGTAVWTLLTFAFNGLIFLLLGLQLPSFIHEGIRLAHGAAVSPWRLLLAVVLITAFLVLLRLAWITCSLLLRAVNARLWRRDPAKQTPVRRPTPRLVAAMSVAGVRGAITLAAVLSLAPDFPGRNLLVTVAAGVIVTSLVLATLALPPLLSGLVMPDVDPMQSEAEHARLAVAIAAIETVEREMHDTTETPHPEEREAVLSELLAEYRGREERLRLSLGDNDDGDERLPALHRHRFEAAMRLRVLRGARETLVHMLRAREINDHTERLLVREIDHQEEVLLAAARSLPELGAGEQPVDGGRA